MSSGEETAVALRKAEKTKAKQQSQLEKLKAELADATDGLARLEASKAEMTSELAELRSNIQAKDGTIADMQSALDSAAVLAAEKEAELLERTDKLEAAVSKAILQHSYIRHNYIGEQSDLAALLYTP